MNNQDLPNEIASMTRFLFELGRLDRQFAALEELVKLEKLFILEHNPRFVEDVMKVYRRTFMGAVDEIKTLMEAIVKTLGKETVRVEALSVSVGAAVRIGIQCRVLEDFFKQGNVEGCFHAFERMKRECASLKENLQIYFQGVSRFGGSAAAAAPPARLEQGGSSRNQR